MSDEQNGEWKTIELKMARADEEDTETVVELLHELEEHEGGVNMYNLEKVENLFELIKRAIPSLNRVLWGYMVLTDPQNQIIDQNSDVLEFHPRFKNVPKVEDAE